jgi:NADH-quinone oxidoreductase subunit M
MNHVPWLTLILVVPLGGALLLQLIPSSQTRAIKGLTVLTVLAVAGIVAGVLMAFAHAPDVATSQAAGLGGGPSRPSPITFQFEEHHDWIPAIGASYHLGVDALSAWLLALDAGVFLLGAVVISRRVTARLKFYCGLLLLTLTATAGVLLSLDLLLFYFFWEAMLIPLYFLLTNYGDQNRGRATLKFIIYTVAGSLAMLLAIIWLYTQSIAALPPTGGASHGTFDFVTLLITPLQSQQPVTILGISTLTPQQWAFMAFVLAFAIKTPLVPFHTWLPDSYASAMPQTLTFFAGIVSKLGAFGFARYCLTLFPGPAHDYRWVIVALALLSILYGALNALSSYDIKRIVAYASISHLGFIVLGIFSFNQNGLNGAIIQMVNHGLLIAALFLIVGWIEERTGTRDIREISGLEKRMPLMYVFFLVVTLAGLGMPGMNTFVGEFTIMLGAFQAAPVLAVIAGVGVVLACWYMLRLHQGLMHDPLSPAAEHATDLGWREAAVLTPLVALMLSIGLYPHPFGVVSQNNVSQYVSVVNAPAQQPQAQSPTSQ